VAKIITKNDIKQAQTLLEGDNNQMSREDLCGIAFYCGFFISFLITSFLFFFLNYKHLLNFQNGNDGS
jgi:hypothetical protein